MLTLSACFVNLCRSINGAPQAAERDDMRKVDFAAGELILQQGEEGDTAFLITAGAVEVLR